MSPSLDPTVQPIVTIILSESNELREGEQMPLARADALFKILDETRHTEREQPGYRGRAYDKTKFRIDFTFRGKADNYEGRQDFGDGDGSLIDHIQEYHEYYSNNESHKNYVILNEGAERWAQEQAEREMLLTEFVPYMRLHCNLYEQERTAADMLESGAELTAAQTAYFNAVISYVGDCRKKLNAGDYDLPAAPQPSDFSQEATETEAYKDYVREELAQEAAAAEMTLEEYADNGYEQGEQPIDAQEQQEVTAVKYYPINEGAARRANDANSFRVYTPGSATSAYRQMVDKAAELAQQQKKRVDSMHYERIDQLLDTYARRLAENMNNSYAIEARVPSILIAGGSNFPVRKKEKQNAARDRNMEDWQDVQGILDKIRSTGMGGISADDPQAVAKLEAKLADLETAQEIMKGVNAYYRKHGTLEGCTLIKPEQIKELQEGMAQSWHLEKNKPFQSFVLSNNNAEIGRIRGRIEQLKQHDEKSFVGWKFDGGRVEANKTDNRLQIFFDKKPDEVARTELKANGFKWSPRAGAWQRQLNDNAYSAAGYVSCIQPATGEKPLDLQRKAQRQQATLTPHKVELQEASPVIDLEELLDEAKDRIEEKAAIEGEAAAPKAPAPIVPSVKREELPKDKDELEAHLAARIETLVSDFALDPDKLMEHIRFTARFHKYSSRNLMLIAEQYPEASFIASFSKFAKGIPDKNGVPLTDKDCSVKKGERAIYIYGYRSTEYVVDPDTGRELAVRHLSDKLAARARDEGWEKRTRTYYPIVPVFDISQTNTPPEVYPAVMGFGGTENRDADAQFRAAKNYAENVLGCSVEICDMGERKATVRGNFTPSENAIRISSMLSGDGALSTLLHEIGHAELHADAEYLKDKPLSQIELEADMLAVMYEDHLGIAQTDARKAHLHSHYTRYLEQLRAEQGEGYDLLGKDSPFEHVVAKYQERIELFDEFQRLQEDFDLEAKAAQSRAVAVAPEMKPAETENRSAKTSGTKL